MEKDIVVKNNGKDVQLTKGEYVCNEYWLNHILRARYWYWASEKKITVRLQHIIHADLCMAEWFDNNPLLQMHPSTVQQICDKICVKLDVQDHDGMMDTAELRGNDFDFEQLFNWANGEI